MATANKAATGVNEVVLSGRLSVDPVQRVLPSGDLLVVCRVVVPRPPARATDPPRRTPTVDVVDLAAWSGRPRKSMTGWREGDEVEVRGALRRRFYRAGGAAASRVEVEVSSGRLLRRAKSG